jgi:long-chain fatty acid transport protein
MYTLYPSPGSAFRCGAAVFAVLAPLAAAHATDGYFSEGYSTINQGMGGASIAYPRDTLTIATNPAGLISVGNRADIGIEFFVPDRGASIAGNAFGPDQGYSANGQTNYYLPSLGYSHLVTPDLALGIAAYGNGGLNTTYNNNPYGRFGGTGAAGVNLDQFFVSPTAAYQFAPGHSIGLSVNIAYQWFSSSGIAAFAPFSQAPADLSNRSTDGAFGGGVRIGYLGHFTPQLSLGVFWQSQTYSQDFTRYQGLFANGGSFNAPSTYGAGVAYAITPALDVAFDVTRIDYSEVASVGNGLSQLFAGNAFGSKNGPGFGWRDVTALKLGANYRLNPEWQVRAGFAYNTQPIPSDQTFLNILAPGVVQWHLTAGASYTLPNGPEISVFALYAPETTVNGSGSIPAGYPPAGFGGGEADIHLSEWAIGISAGWKL